MEETRATSAAVYDGRYVTFAGRTMLRAAGADDVVEPEETPGAPAEPVEAASTEGGAPAQTPDYEQRYTSARSELDRKNSLIDRARNGDGAALNELVGLDFYADEEPPETETTETEPLTAIEQRQTQLEQRLDQSYRQQVMRDFNAHLTDLAGDLNLNDDDRTLIYVQAVQANDGTYPSPETTEKAFSALKTRREETEKAAIERYIQGKKNAPRVTASGTGATEAPFRDEMSVRELTKAAQEQFRLSMDQ